MSASTRYAMIDPAASELARLRGEQLDRHGATGLGPGTYAAHVGPAETVAPHEVALRLYPPPHERTWPSLLARGEDLEPDERPSIEELTEQIERSGPVFGPVWLVGEPEAIKARLLFVTRLTAEQRAALHETADLVKAPSWEAFVACRTRHGPILVQGPKRLRGDEQPQYRMFGNHALAWRSELVVAEGHYAVRIEHGEDARPPHWLRWSVEEWLVGPLGDLAAWLADPGKVGPREVRHALSYRGAFGHTELPRRLVEVEIARLEKHAARAAKAGP